MKLESRYIFILAIPTLLIVGAFILTKHLGFASRLIEVVFWMILSAVILYIWETKNEH